MPEIIFTPMYPDSVFMDNLIYIVQFRRSFDIIYRIWNVIQPHDLVNHGGSDLHMIIVRNLQLLPSVQQFVLVIAVNMLLSWNGRALPI